eukprot:7384083-Prymnesium_polylepis.1
MQQQVGRRDARIVQGLVRELGHHVPSGWTFLAAVDVAIASRVRRAQCQRRAARRLVPSPNDEARGIDCERLHPMVLCPVHIGLAHVRQSGEVQRCRPRRRLRRHEAALRCPPHLIRAHNVVQMIASRRCAEGKDRRVHPGCRPPAVRGRRRAAQIGLAVSLRSRGSVVRVHARREAPAHHRVGIVFGG